MQFEQALALAKQGNRIAAGDDFIFSVQYPDESSMNTHAYLYKEVITSDVMAAASYRVPWTPSQEDLFRDDYQPIGVDE